jgi:hypothetical protein
MQTMESIYIKIGAIPMALKIKTYIGGIDNRFDYFRI